MYRQLKCTLRAMTPNRRSLNHLLVPVVVATIAWLPACGGDDNVTTSSASDPTSSTAGPTSSSTEGATSTSQGTTSTSTNDTTEGDTTASDTTEGDTTTDPIEPEPGQCRAHGDCEQDEYCWEPTPECPSCNWPIKQCTTNAECDAIEPGWTCQFNETPCVCGFQSGRVCGPPCIDESGCDYPSICHDDGSCHLGCGCIDDGVCEYPDGICISKGFSCGVCVIGCKTDDDCTDGVCVNRECSETFGTCVMPLNNPQP